MRLNTSLVAAMTISLVLCMRAFASNPPVAEQRSEEIAQLPPPPFGVEAGGSDVGPPHGLAIRAFALNHEGPLGPFPPPLPPPGDMVFMAAPFLIPIPPEVEISDDQVERLSQLKSDVSKNTGQITSKIATLEHDRSQALLQDKLDVSEISKQNSEISAQKQLLDGIFSEARLQAAQVLTPEQRRKIRLLRERRGLGQMQMFKSTSHERD
jgi:hypothetical protein